MPGYIIKVLPNLGFVPKGSDTSVTDASYKERIVQGTHRPTNTLSNGRNIETFHRSMTPNR